MMALKRIRQCWATRDATFGHTDRAAKAVAHTAGVPPRDSHAVSILPVSADRDLEAALYARGSRRE